MSPINYIGLNTVGANSLKTIVDVAPQAALTIYNWLRVAINSSAVGAKVGAVILPEKKRLETAYGMPGAPVEPVDVMTWGSLGDIEFDMLSAPTKLSGAESVKYAQHAVIGGKPHVQFTAPALRAIKLQISWHTLVMEDIEARFNALRDAMNENMILPLVIGGQAIGAYFAGHYVIQSLPYEVLKYRADGKIMALTATIELLEWNTGGPLAPGEHAPPPAVRKPGQTPNPAQESVSRTPGNGMAGATRWEIEDAGE
jgi:hypothetical protein